MVIRDLSANEGPIPDKVRVPRPLPVTDLSGDVALQELAHEVALADADADVAHDDYQAAMACATGVAGGATAMFAARVGWLRPAVNIGNSSNNRNS